MIALLESLDVLAPLARLGLEVEEPACRQRQVEKFKMN